jgi:5-methylcytosine-specific restriction endonuclease McrA
MSDTVIRDERGNRRSYKLTREKKPCWRCGNVAFLDKHHLKEGGSRTGEVILLCRPCHNSEHGFKPKIRISDSQGGVKA